MSTDERKVKYMTAGALTGDGYGGHAAGCPELKGKGACGCSKQEAGVDQAEKSKRLVEGTEALKAKVADLKERISDLKECISRLEKEREAAEPEYIIGDLDDYPRPRPHALMAVDDDFILDSDPESSSLDKMLGDAGKSGVSALLKSAGTTGGEGIIFEAPRRKKTEYII